MGQEDLLFKLGVDANGIERGLTSVQAKVKSFSHEVIGSLTGAFAVGVIVERFGELATRLRDLQRTAKELGVSFEFLQVSQYAATKMGGNAEDATTALEKLNLKIGEAQTVSEEAAKAFKDAGVALVNTNGTARSTDAVFRDIADRIKNAGSAAEKAAIAHEFFGRSANNIRGILDGGSAAIDEFTKKAKNSGKIVGAEFAAEINDLSLAVKNNASVFEFWAGASATLFNAPGKLLGNLSAFLEDTEKLKNEIKELQAIVDSGAHKEAYSAKDAELRNIAASDLAKKNKELETRQTELNALEKKRNADLLKVGKEFEASQRDTEKEASQFAINDALKVELGLRLRLANMAEDDPKRGRVLIQVQKASAETTKAELAAKQASLRNLMDMEKELSEEIKGMGYADDVKLEKEKKKIELAKLQKDIAAGALDIEKMGIALKEKRLSLERSQAGIQKSLRETKEDRTKYTLEELRTGNPFGVDNAKLREEMLKIPEIDRLQRLGDEQRQLGHDKEAGEFYSKRDKLVSGLSYLKSGEKPFKVMEDSLEAIRQELGEIKAKQDALPKAG